MNIKKSQVIVFNKAGRLVNTELFYKGMKLEIVKSYTYLGIDITASGTFSPAIKELTMKAKKAMIPLYRLIKQFQIPFGKSLKLFRTYIEPILLYNAENWSTFTEKQIEKCKNNHRIIYENAVATQTTVTQLKFLKFILGVGKQCPTLGVLGECAQVPLTMKGQVAMLKYWNRISRMGEEVLVKKAYLENIAMNTNWCQTVQILNAAHKLNTRPLTMIEYHRTAPCRSSENWKAYWKNSVSAQITGSGKLGMYARLKSEFQRDPYLDLPTFEKRQVITKFICSNHSLYIETDRHRDRESSRAIRTCQVCTRGAIEDERHFLIEFPVYETIRGVDHS